jgi:Predicted membrane protein, hemolysin III homolog
MQKVQRSQVIYEIWNAITHGVAFVASLGLVALLIMKSISNGLPTRDTISLVIYGATLLALYLASTLFHCLAFTKAKRIFQIIDHSNIFLLIAGTYTPYCIIFFRPAQRDHHAKCNLDDGNHRNYHPHFKQGRFQKVETTIYVVMGWLCLLAGKTLYANLSPLGFWLLVAGGVTFTVARSSIAFLRFPDCI